MMIFFQQPFTCNVDHKFGVCCVGSGPVICTVTLDRGGYVPGESIGMLVFMVFIKTNSYGGRCFS